MKTLTPMRLTQADVLAAFPDSLSINNEKIAEWKGELSALREEIMAALELSRGHDEMTREVWTEWLSLNYDPALKKVNGHLFRLHSNLEVLLGVKREGQITPDMVEAAKAVSIESLADMELRRSGKRLRGLCPFHQERSPSFTIYPDTNTWHCFGACARGGDSIDFAMLNRGLDFHGAVKHLAGRTI